MEINDDYPSDYEKEDIEDDNSDLEENDNDITNFDYETKSEYKGESEYKAELKGKELKNKSFTYFEIREIENSNSVLMKKVLAQTDRRRQYKTSNSVQPKKTSAEINRRKKQRQTDHDNLVLLKKIQGIKSFGLSKSKSSLTK